jgi:hypothetical protein
MYIGADGNWWSKLEEFNMEVNIDRDDKLEFTGSENPVRHMCL